MELHTRILEALARVARSEETVVSMLEAARACVTQDRVFEELVYALSEPAVYGAPKVHAALGTSSTECHAFRVPSWWSPSGP